MADFSPTGYWAHYQDGDDTFSMPVISFVPDKDIFTTRHYATVCHEEGFLVRADSYDSNGKFLDILPRPAGE